MQICHRFFYSNSSSAQRGCEPLLFSFIHSTEVTYRQAKNGKALFVCLPYQRLCSQNANPHAKFIENVCERILLVLLQSRKQTYLITWSDFPTRYQHTVRLWSVLLVSSWKPSLHLFLMTVSLMRKIHLCHTKKQPTFWIQIFYFPYGLCLLPNILLEYFAGRRTEMNVLFNFGGGSEAKAKCFLPLADDSIMILIIIPLSWGKISRREWAFLFSARSGEFQMKTNWLSWT